MAKAKKITNIEQLRDDTLAMREQLQNRKIDIPLAKEINNSTGKVIKTCILQLEYAKMRKTKPNIKFLGGTTR